MYTSQLRRIRAHIHMFYVLHGFHLTNWQHTHRYGVGQQEMFPNGSLDTVLEKKGEFGCMGTSYATPVVLRDRE